MPAPRVADPSPASDPGALSDDDRAAPKRRDLLKLGLTALPLAAAPTRAADEPLDPGDVSSLPPSPPTTPFLEALPIIPELKPRPLTDPAFWPAPTVAPNRTKNPATNMPYEGRGDAHQLHEASPHQQFYAQRFGAVPAFSIHPNLPTGAPSGGFGKNSISIHLHNFHSAPDSDGGPCDPGLGQLSENPLTQGRFFFPGQYYDYYYNMKRAGFNNPATPDGDVRQSLGTLWYHDHREAHTGENVYKGLCGFHVIFNEYDTGDENTGFRLPSYPAYDIPIVFTDLAIDPITYQTNVDLLLDGGHIGDKFLVNGKVQPYCKVYKRRYRFRLLNMGPSRHYEMYLTNPDNPAQSIPYWRIANDGNLYEKPLKVTNAKLAPAERADIIVDFKKLTAAGGPAAGATRLWLENRLIQVQLRKPEEDLDPPGTVKNVLVEFRIGGTAVDNSRDPAKISSFAPITLPPLPPIEETITRHFKWERGNGAWQCNGKFLDCNEIRFTMKRGRTERWIHETGGGWAHPIHNHFVEGRIVKRNGKAIGPGSQEYCRKDVVALYPGDTVEYWVTALDYVGVYPMHCHNVIHEDYGMMLLFRVDDVGDTKSRP